jgi:hypothetical protein
MMKNWLKISQFIINFIRSDEKYILVNTEITLYEKDNDVKMKGWNDEE